MNKQLGEMAKLICEHTELKDCAECDVMYDDGDCTYKEKCLALYNAGYRKRQETIREICEELKNIICENTYPGFDKNGKAVNIWKSTIGYDAIDDLIKEMGELTLERNEFELYEE